MRERVPGEQLDEGTNGGLGFVAEVKGSRLVIVLVAKKKKREIRPR